MSSVIKRTDRRIKGKRDEASRSRRSQRVRSRKNIKIREVVEYLVQWKGFTVEHNSWKREKDLKNAKEVVTEFERRLNAEIRRQEKLDMMEERDFRRGELPERYTVKMLYK